jgi:hypothetical protein
LDRVSESREKRLENLATGIARLREAISRQLEDSVGHSEVGEWNTGGTKPHRDLAARSPEVLALGFASREVPRAEVRVDVRGRA